MQKALKLCLPVATVLLLAAGQAGAAPAAVSVSGPRLALLAQADTVTSEMLINLPSIPNVPRAKLPQLPTFPQNPGKAPPARTPSSQPQPSPTPPPSSSPGNGGQVDSVRQKILDLVNAERSKNGLSGLAMESHLQTAAQRHAEDMKNRNFFDHVNPDGKSPTDRIRAAGYPMNGAWSTGENIAKGQTTAEQVMKDWMNSPGHRANILSKNFKEIGIGYIGNYWVQNFGSHN